MCDVQAEPRQAASKPHAPSESESFWPSFGGAIAWTSRLFVLSADTEAGRRWGRVRGDLGDLGWLDTGLLPVEKSLARRLRRFFIGAYFGGGISLFSPCENKHILGYDLMDFLFKVQIGTGRRISTVGLRSGDDEKYDPLIHLIRLRGYGEIYTTVRNNFEST